MKVKEVTLCDECKDRIGSQACYLCDKDVCKTCICYASLYVEGESIINIIKTHDHSDNKVQVPLCYTCANGIKISTSYYKTTSRDKEGKSVFEYDKARLKLVKNIIKMLYRFSVMKKV